MQQYHKLRIQLHLERAEGGLHQKTLGLLLGGPTQAFVSWWESGRYLPGDRYLRKLDQFLNLDQLALRVYVLASGLQPGRKHGCKTKPSFLVLKMDQNGARPSRRV